MATAKQKEKRTPAEITADPRRTGRPPLPKRRGKTDTYVLRMTKAERRILDAEARKRGICVSDVLMTPWRKGG